MPRLLTRQQSETLKKPHLHNLKKNIEACRNSTTSVVFAERLENLKKKKDWNLS